MNPEGDKVKLLFKVVQRKITEVTYPKTDLIVGLLLV
jgi:hypothetical protein